MASSLSHREKEKLAKFRGGTQSFRQWMLSIERQIGSEDPRLWMLIHRTVDFTVPIVQQVIEDYVTNMRDDTVYWQTQSDGTTKGEFAYRYTELSTLVMKLYYRLLDALEDEALAYIETQQVARNGCEVLRLLKSRYALETQYIETDLITKVHTWTFDKNDLERSIIEWERLIHRLSTQHNFKFEPRQLFAILIRGLPEDLRLTMNRDGIVEFLALRGRVIEYCRNKRLSDPIHSNEVNSAMMCPVRKGTTKGVSKGRYADGKSGISWEQKGRGKQGKGKGKKEHDYASMFYYFLDGHSRSNLHVSLPIQDFIRLVRGSWQSRESTMRKTPYRAPPSVATQVRKGTSKGGSSKGRDHTATHSTYPWSQPSNSWNTTGQTNSWNRSLNPSQHSSDTVWQRNLKRKTDVPMDLDFMTAPVVDEFGHAEYDNTIGEHIMNSLDEYDEEDTQFFDAHDDASHDVEGYEESGDPTYYNDDWSMTYDGTDHSLSMIRLGSVGMSDKPTPIHYLEKTMNEAFIGSSTTEPFDPEKHDGLLFDSGAALNVCPKHYAEEIPIQPLPDTCNLRIANGQRLQTYGLRTVGYELTDRQRRVHLYVDYVVCDADRPILSVVRLLESGWSIRLKGKQRLMVKDDVRIELTTHRGLLYVNPMHRIPPERMTPPKHIGVVYHINPNKPKTVYVGPIQRTDKDHWRLENGHLVRVHRKWRKALFEPREQREMPISFEKLLGQRTTTIEYEDGHVETINDDWLTSLNPTRCAPRGLWWRGTTKIRHKPLIDEPITRRQPMSTTSANHETQDQPSTPLISEHARDYWENVDGKWKRHHVRPRSRLYRPGAEQQPSEQGPPETLVRGRRTIMQFSDGSMMEHHDDWTRGDDELENETRKWTGITEFSNRNEDRNASEEVQEAIPDDPEQLRETQPARGLPVPRQPSQHEREEHELTHLPFRAWCKTCVAAKARQAYHTKQPDRRDCLQLDFGFLTEGNRQDAVLVVTDARTGCCAALLCETKHTTETLIRFVLSFIYETGRTHTHRYKRTTKKQRKP